MKKRSFAGIAILILILSVILYSPNCKKQAIEKQTSSSTDLHSLIKTDLSSECYDATSFEGGLTIDSVLKRYDSAIRQMAKRVFDDYGIQFTDTNYKKFTNSLRLERQRVVVTDPWDNSEVSSTKNN